MSLLFGEKNKPTAYIDVVDYIVPARIREAVSCRGFTIDLAAKECGISQSRFRRLCNGSENATDTDLSAIMNGLGFQKPFFYKIRWEQN